MKSKVFQTAMTQKGQVMIFKEIREKLGLKKNQKFIERTEGNKIVLEPVPSLVSLGGSLSKIGKNKTIEQLIKETKEGWD